jgi:two-component system, LuxR family, response regulator FixJ
MTEPIHVALINDDAAVLDSLRLYFVRNLVATSCFVSAEALLAALAEGTQPECILSDIRMPGMSGLDLLHCLKQRCIAVRLVLLAAPADSNWRSSPSRAARSMPSRSHSTNPGFSPAF